jgi:hypothetical protein
MPAELRKRKEKAPPAKAEDMPPAKKAEKAAPAPKRKGKLGVAPSNTACN